MSVSQFSVICAGLLLACVLPAASQDSNGQPGTVDYFTPAERTSAFGASTRAGYAPTGIEMFQDGNFFLTARKDGQTVQLTVRPDGRIFASAPVVPLS